MSVNNFCKLCNVKAKLIRKSHIIPNFMYEGLFDDSRKMLMAHLNDLNKTPQIAQTGIFEKYILCHKCENMFSRNERYMSHFFNGPIKSPLKLEKRRSHDGLRTIFISGIDCNRFKHFMLSILWRSHISENKFFSNVNIKECADEVRQLLIENNNFPDEDYKIGMMGFQNNANELVRFIINPSVLKIGNGNIAMFFINGFAYFIDLKPKSEYSAFEKLYLKNNGELEVPILNGDMAIEYLSSLGINRLIAEKYIRNV